MLFFLLKTRMVYCENQSVEMAFNKLIAMLNKKKIGKFIKLIKSTFFSLTHFSITYTTCIIVTLK